MVVARLIETGRKAPVDPLVCRGAVGRAARPGISVIERELNRGNRATQIVSNALEAHLITDGERALLRLVGYLDLVTVGGLHALHLGL